MQLLVPFDHHFSLLSLSTHPPLPHQLFLLLVTAFQDHLKFTPKFHFSVYTYNKAPQLAGYASQKTFTALPFVTGLYTLRTNPPQELFQLTPVFILRLIPLDSSHSRFTLIFTRAFLSI